MRVSVRSFLFGRAGNVAIIFGLSLIPLFGFVGLSVDYTRALQAHSAYGNIADAAALGAVANQSINPNQTAAQQIAAAQALAKKLFDDQIAQRGLTTTSSNAVASNPTGAIQVQVTYTAEVPSSFGALFGMSSYTIGGTATAEGGTPKYIDIYILVDSSTSMGVGATLADQLIMANTPSVGCMVACHSDGTDTLAHAAGAKLRFDVIRSAIQQVVAQAQTTMTATHSVIRLGVYTFAGNFQTEVDITSNYAAINNAVNNMQLASLHAGTNTYKALNTLRTKIGAVGDGYTPSTPLSFVILATDGTGNSVDNNTPTTWTISPDIYPPYSLTPTGLPFPRSVPDLAHADNLLQGVDPAWCQQFKDMNVDVMTLVTPYVVPTPSNGGSPTEAASPRVIYLRDVLVPVIPTQMAACASQPSYFYSASSPAEITAAMTALFKNAITKLSHLSQ
jgi:Flp pilus assembly protein TadG